MIQNEEGASLYVNQRDAIETTGDRYRLRQYLFWKQREGSRLFKYLFRNLADRDQSRKNVFDQEVSHLSQRNQGWQKDRIIQKHFEFFDEQSPH